MLVEAPYIHRAGPVQPVEYLVETLVVGEYRVEFLLAEFGVIYHDIYVEMAFKLTMSESGLSMKRKSLVGCPSRP